MTLYSWSLASTDVQMSTVSEGMVRLQIGRSPANYLQTSEVYPKHRLSCASMEQPIHWTCVVFMAISGELSLGA